MPMRYGDVFDVAKLPQLTDAKGKSWSWAMVLHPSCELTAKASDDREVVVVRLRRVGQHSRKQAAALRLGWSEAGGVIRIAFANTFWVPPIPTSGSDEDWYADFRTSTRVPLDGLEQSGRATAMTHEARVYLLRRDLYFRYRWVVSLEDVRALERVRIMNDPRFMGPRPDWV